MTSKERMLIAMKNGKPDMVPVSPDISNMIPCRLTGKPFWDIYLYQDPPLWKAYIDAVKYFGFDGWLSDDRGVNSIFVENEQPVSECKRETVIILKSSERIITREYTEKEKGKKEWSDFITVYFVADPPTSLKASKIGMEFPPAKFWPIEGVKPQKKDLELLKEVKEYMGEDGVVGISVGIPFLSQPGQQRGYSVYDYYDKYDEVKEWSFKVEKRQLNRLERILSFPIKPDYILTGGSGCLISHTPAILKDIALTCLQKITKMCKDAGIPSQVHCCGPEKEMVKMCAEETDLDNINPLEIPPMGDCNLKEIKKKFGRKISLMGNLHTTEVMLRGSAKDVERESLKAILDAGVGGGFILSTGDQCGRDTPNENIFAMKEMAEKFGQYPLDIGKIKEEIQKRK